jgi:hypothetical protein
MAWAAIWQDGATQDLRGPSIDRDAGDAPLPALSLLLEITAPRPMRRPVRLWQGAAPAQRAMAVYLMPDGAVRVLHGEFLDQATPPAFLAPGQLLALRMVACARGRADAIDMRNADTGARWRLRLGIARAPRLDEALPCDAGYASSAHVAAIATHPLRSSHLPGIADGARILTPEGQVAVETLRPGMQVCAPDGSAHTIRWIEARDMVCLGQTAPIRLRAPYFGLGADVCVTPETRIARNGAEVEYLAGRERVLVRAGDLVPGRAAVPDRSRPVRRFHHILLDDPACISVWRCAMETAFLSEVLAAEDARPAAARPVARDCSPSLPVLDKAAARALLGRSARAQSFVL